VHSNSASAVAWVESPLQLLSAVEYAAASGMPMDIVARKGGAQLPQTAARLIELGLPEGTRIGHRSSAGFLALALRRTRHWIVGDAFSGVVRGALSMRSPSRLTVLDDGSTSLLLPAVVTGIAPLTRTSIGSPPLHERARTAFIGLCDQGRLEFFSMYALDVPQLTLNNFAWLRSRGIDSHHGPVVILGSAAVVDGLSSRDAYLDWVAAQPRPATYFPHRRETEALLALVAHIDGVSISNSGLPIELTLAGAGRLQIRSLPSSATRSLGIILEGSGSVITTETLAETTVYS
jgi:hypothetical protein